MGKGFIYSATSKVQEITIVPQKDPILVGAAGSFHPLGVAFGAWQTPLGLVHHSCTLGPRVALTPFAPCGGGPVAKTPGSPSPPARWSGVGALGGPFAPGYAISFRWGCLRQAIVHPSPCARGVV